MLDATAIWWRIQLDPESRDLDDEFTTAVDRAIGDTEDWAARAPEDAEAWFYLGAAYAARVQWRVLREEKLAAARDGKRIKDALERALALEPDLDDAYFGIGMYRYYADVAPAAARFLRFLLLLPGGDRKDGLAQMLRARGRRAGSCRARPTISSTSSISGTSAGPIARSSCSRTCGIATRATRCFRCRSPTSRTPTCTTSRPASIRGDRCWAWPATAASTPRRSPRSGRASGWRGISTRSAKPMRRSHSCSR